MKSLPSRVRDFLYIFVPFLIITATIVGSYQNIILERHKNELLLKEEGRLTLVDDIAGRLFRTAITDLLVLSESESLMLLLRNPSKKARQARLAREFAIFSRRKGTYDQIRLINMQGQEVVRVDFNNGDPAILPRSYLQDKSSRYYFKIASKLNKAEVYTSPLDLNVERDTVEKPDKPMIRFATPVFDSYGERKGIIILNYFASEFLNQLAVLMKNGNGRPILTDNEGHWLYGSESDNGRSFTFDKAGSFAARHEQVWKEMAKASSGKVASENGIYVYLTSKPLREALARSGQRKSRNVPPPTGHEADSYQWKIISYIPAIRLISS